MDDMTLLVNPETRDIVLVDGDIAMAHGPEVPAQGVRSVLLTYKGEWFLDPVHGTDYARIMGESPTEREMEGIICEAVFQETDVKHIDELAVSWEGRCLRIKLSGRLSGGVPISVEV